MYNLSLLHKMIYPHCVHISPFLLVSLPFAFVLLLAMALYLYIPRLFLLDS
jgi:hypothetical protein